MVASGLISVYIYFDKIEHVEITEVESMSSFNLLANIGGTLGLFIGVSVLSFVEVIELTIEMGLVFVQNFIQKRITRRREYRRNDILNSSSQNKI